MSPTSLATAPHTNDTAGALRAAEGFAHARAGGRSALIPYVVAGYPDADASFEIACAAIDAGADLLEVGLPYSDPLADGATLQRASQGALAAGATFDRSLALVARIAAARPSVPIVPMGYANQLIGGGDGRDRARALASAGAAAVIVADLTPDEGAPVRARGGRSGDRGRLPGRADNLARSSRRRGRAERRVPLLRFARRGDGRADVAATDGLAARPRGQGRVSCPGGGRVRGVEARPCPRDREGRCRGVIVASALVDALGPDGRDINALTRLVTNLRAATA